MAIDPNLFNYINGALAQGKTRQEISSVLMSQGGWNQADVDTAIAAVQGNVAAPVVVNSTQTPWFVGIILLAIAIVGNYFYWRMTLGDSTIVLAVAGWIGVTLLVNVLFVGLFALIFKTQGNQFLKATLFVGICAIGSLVIEAAPLIHVPSIIQGIFSLVLLVLAIVLLVKIYTVSVLKAIGIFICASFFTAVVSGIIAMILLFTGLISFAGVISSSLETNQPLVTESVATSSVPEESVQTIIATSSATSTQSSASQQKATSTTSQTVKKAAVVSSNTPKNFACSAIKNLTFTSKVPYGSLAIGWGKLPIQGVVYGNYDSDGWKPFPPSYDPINHSLLPFAIMPAYYGNIQDNYAGGVMNVTCTDGQKVAIYIPSFKNIIGDKGYFIDQNNKRFTGGFYVATDGSTYYDIDLTNLARKAGK